MEAARSPAEAAPPERVEDGAADLHPLHPRVRVLWWILNGILVLVLTLLALGADFLFEPPLPRGLLPAAVAVVGGLLGAYEPVLRYSRWRYSVRESDLWIRRGVLWVTTSVIPLSRLQFVDTRQGPLERLLGLSSLVVHTAALGTSGRVPGLQLAEAERLRERLARVEIDASTV
jgi:membrane protein YdbS with pleckstrin-like domain